MSIPTPKLSMASIPSEILHHIAESYLYDLDPLTCNIVSVLTTCSLFRDLFLTKLYSNICIYSLDQLSRFVSPTSGAHIYCPHYTLDTLTINIPGVPGGGDGTLPSTVGGMSRSRDRLLLASLALSLCPKVQKVSLEFFSIRHSEILTSDNFRATEAQAFENAIKGLKSVKHLRWVPPRCDTNPIRGLSIVIVDQVIPSLAKGLIGCENLETLELWNTMLPLTRGSDLAQSLIQICTVRQDWKRTMNLNLRSITGLDPKVVSNLVLASPPIKVNIADGFVGSIWGARIDKHAVQECMRDTLNLNRDSTSSTSQTSSKASSIATSRTTSPELLIQTTLAKASENINITILQGGIAGCPTINH
ncbi:uncharacterized protein MEPE_04227 [Melanopsichium pennsylvanicum]|uniref:Uncharacterized protein n=2 Tax=Melanopsichium pennsylvanicum TaxID=63383 RepID=A0AAJ4XNR4_9BASI|nr:putative protein [Melanopsichium pennsylvanicum 4]SNX85518.1 uncharacterized protein MEPE_04227 [Melanopsichium pennsylvanicum]